MLSNKTVFQFTYVHFISLPLCEPVFLSRFVVKLLLFIQSSFVNELTQQKQFSRYVSFILIVCLVSICVLILFATVSNSVFRFGTRQQISNNYTQLFRMCNVTNKFGLLNTIAVRFVKIQNTIYVTAMRTKKNYIERKRKRKRERKRIIIKRENVPKTHFNKNNESMDSTAVALFD